MATTYTLIASVTVGSGGANTISFSSIPATYTDLQILISARSDRSLNVDNVEIRFNSSASNRSYRRLYGDNAAYTDSGSALPVGHISGNNATANSFGSCSIDIPNYASSNYKSFSAEGVGESNESAVYKSLVAGLWSNTDAINAVTLYADGGSQNFMQYSTAYLYGISKT